MNQKVNLLVKIFKERFLADLKCQRFFLLIFKKQILLNKDSHKQDTVESDDE